jgi:hypothetical protein
MTTYAIRHALEVLGDEGYDEDIRRAAIAELDDLVAKYDDVIALLHFGNANGETEAIRAWCALTLREIEAS